MMPSVARLDARTRDGKAPATGRLESLPCGPGLRRQRALKRGGSPSALGNCVDATLLPFDCTGAVGEGRAIEFAGDTNTEYDPTGHALVVLEGNFEEEEMTEAQLETLLHITTWLARKWNVPPDEIGGHKDHARTACPGQSLYAYLPELRRQVAESLK